MQTTANNIKRTRRAVVVTVLPSALALVVGLALWRVVADAWVGMRVGTPTTPADALVVLLAALGLVGIGWLLLGVLLELLARVPGAVGRAAATVSAALSPRVVRRGVALVLGVGVGAGVSGGGAQAAPAHVVAVVRTAVDPAHDQGAAVPAGAVAVGAGLPDPSWGTPPDPGWTPAPPRVRPQPDLGVLAGRSASASEHEPEVVVHRGDSLWLLAARHLGEGATDAEIAAEWPRWYAANRQVIGPDPDLLLPGQVLRAPTARPGRARRGGVVTATGLHAAARPVRLPPAVPLDEAVRRARARTEVARVPGYVQDALAVDFACASDEQVFGPQRTSRSDLPDPTEWAARMAHALLEVMTGLRPAPQVLRWTTPEVYAVVARRGALEARRGATGPGRRPRHRVAVRRIRLCEPADGVAEAAVVVQHGTRVRAVALRLVGQDGKWRVSALQVG